MLDKNLKAVFFDMDGVLVLSERTHNQAWQCVCEKICKEATSVDFNLFIGKSDAVFAKHLIESFAINYSVFELCSMKRAIFVEFIENGLLAPKGRDALLEHLYGTYKLGVVSSSSSREVKTVLKNQKIDHFFDFVVAFEDVSSHKPDPMPYLRALELAKTDPSKALVFEDSPAGVQAARQANIPVIALATNYSFFPDYPEVPVIADYSEFRRV